MPPNTHPDTINHMGEPYVRLAVVVAELEALANEKELAASRYAKCRALDVSRTAHEYAAKTLRRTAADLTDEYGPPEPISDAESAVKAALEMRRR